MTSQLKKQMGGGGVGVEGHPISLVTRTSDDSTLPLTEGNFVFAYLYI